MSSTDLINSLFGIDGKDFAMMSQFEDCSYEQFNTAPFHGKTSDGEITSNDALETRANKKVIDKSTGMIQDLVSNKAESMMSNLRAQADFIIISLPLGQYCQESLNGRHIPLSIHRSLFSMMSTLAIHQFTRMKSVMT